MKSLEQINEMNEILSVLNTATADNTGFIGEEEVIEITGVLAKEKVEPILRKYLQENKVEIIEKMKKALAKDIRDAKKEYLEHIESEKSILKGIK